MKEDDFENAPEFGLSLPVLNLSSSGLIDSEGKKILCKCGKDATNFVCGKEHTLFSCYECLHE